MTQIVCDLSINEEERIKSFKIFCSSNDSENLIFYLIQQYEITGSSIIENFMIKCCNENDISTEIRFNFAKCLINYENEFHSIKRIK